MTARDEPRRGMRRLFHDPWRKLASVALAIGLWFFLDARVTDDHELSCELRFADLDDWNRNQQQHDETLAMLNVLVPADEYIVTGYSDPITDQQITRVVIHLHGAKRLMSRKGASGPFVVDTSSMKIDPTAQGFEFDLADVQTRDEDLKPLLEDMTPARVRVELTRKDKTEPLTLVPDMFTLTFDDAVRSMYDRIEASSARFQPPTVTLTGRWKFIEEFKDRIAKARAGGQVPEFFRVHLDSPPAPNAREIRAQLSRNPELLSKGIDFSPENVEVILPVRPEYHEFELLVPALLVPAGSGLDPADFQALEKQKVMLSAAGQLASELALKKPEALQAWAAENTVVLVPLPKEAENGKSTTISGRFTFLKDTAYRTPADYKVSAVPVIVYPKKDKQQGG